MVLYRYCFQNNWTKHCWKLKEMINPHGPRFYRRLKRGKVELTWYAVPTMWKWSQITLGYQIYPILINADDHIMSSFRLTSFSLKKLNLSSELMSWTSLLLVIGYKFKKHYRKLLEWIKEIGLFWKLTPRYFKIRQ